MNITLVKKIKADGSPCQKCQDISDRLEASDQMKLIDQIIIADESDPASEGMLLASELSVDRAPFFVVEHDDGQKEVFTVYFKFVKQVLNQITSEEEELAEIMNDNPDLDYI